MGYQKIWTVLDSLDMPTLSIPLPSPQKKSYAYRTDNLSMCTRFSRDFRLEF